ncbi:hypothetical protein GH714_033358 [Hevea brasiliensis]|uniref:Aspartic peptidase DDI1-type domain-containing protein n=1 Tax=Hevea brasiliensis TaxID=3981 RepID=A0A6A6L2S8_HEVBR|nr:hypothetical protein GH714_033358 [Hevea brasiliensis]
MGKQSYGASVVTKTQPISSVSKLQELPVQKFPDHNSSGLPKLAFPSTTMTPPRPSSTFSRNRDTRHYTHQEFLELRAKGLCYKCMQPFHPMHECPNKSLRALIIGDDEEKPQDPELGLSELDPPLIEVINEAYFNTMDLPFYSIGGISSPKTLKLQGRICGTDVTVLIDNGASHNFILGNLSSKLNLTIESTPSFGVRLGDGHRVQSMGVCRQLQLDLGNLEVKVDCYLFPLGGVDIILGVAWLETLGDIRINWATMQMSFYWKHEVITLSGNPSLTGSAVTVSQLHKILDVDYSVYLWQLSDVAATYEFEDEISPSQQNQLQLLLDQFQHVFGDIETLPPIGSMIILFLWLLAPLL